jgi:rhodanese-related sulfurtransferase
MLACLIGGLIIGREVLRPKGKLLSWEAVFEEIERRWPSVPQMTPNELARRLARPDGEGRPVLIDVRRRDEYETSHLPGAVHAGSPGGIQALVGEPVAGHEVVLYCSVGIRSSAAANRLMAGGFTNVYNLQGSIFQWANEGHPIVRDGQPTDTVHPYNPEWGQLLNASHHPVKVP